MFSNEILFSQICAIKKEINYILFGLNLAIFACFVDLQETKEKTKVIITIE